MYHDAGLAAQSGMLPGHYLYVPSDMNDIIK